MKTLIKIFVAAFIFFLFIAPFQSEAQTRGARRTPAAGPAVEAPVVKTAAVTTPGVGAPAAAAVATPGVGAPGPGVTGTPGVGAPGVGATPGVGAGAPGPGVTPGVGTPGVGATPGVGTPGAGAVGTPATRKRH